MLIARIFGTKAPDSKPAGCLIQLLFFGAKRNCKQFAFTVRMQSFYSKILIDSTINQFAALTLLFLLIRHQSSKRETEAQSRRSTRRFCLEPTARSVHFIHLSTNNGVWRKKHGSAWRFHLQRLGTLYTTSNSISLHWLRTFHRLRSPFRSWTLGLSPTLAPNILPLPNPSTNRHLFLCAPSRNLTPNPLLLSLQLLVPSRNHNLLRKNRRIRLDVIRSLYNYAHTIPHHTKPFLLHATTNLSIILLLPRTSPRHYPRLGFQ